MRRADRLFRIVQLLRGRRLTTAQQLADWLEVSQRTIYRDVRDLSISGVPIEGEAGVGYRLRAGFELPPLMFDADEAEALVAGLRMVRAWAGPNLSRAAALAQAKIASALPSERRALLERTKLFAPSGASGADRAHLDVLHRAIAERTILALDYRDAGERASVRRVWPLGLNYWGKVWTLAAWCELRQDFRDFRIDRMVGLSDAGERFPDTAGRRLADYVRAVEARMRAAECAAAAALKAVPA